MAALLRITTELRAVAAAHVSFKLVDRRRLRPADDVERDSLMGLAAEAANFQKAIAGIEGIAERRRRLRRSSEAKHALIPGLAGETIASLRAAAAR
jgi:hypothetical protein